MLEPHQRTLQAAEKIERIATGAEVCVTIDLRDDPSPDIAAAASHRLDAADFFKHTVTEFVLTKQQHYALQASIGQKTTTLFGHPIRTA